LGIISVNYGAIMTFEEYVKGGRAEYQAFVEAVMTILAAAVKVHKLVPHALTGRAKKLDSLAKKLDERKIEFNSAIDQALKDLAGVRIVFLTNGQVDLFGRADILQENFEVLNVNVHHPVPGTETEDRLFDSTNYMVALKPERLTLPEYAPFEGMRCEIQLQTLLNHAWAEMDHDAFYKKPDIGRVGEKRLKTIKKRMDDVMRKHLLPAGHDFDRIAGDIHRLLQADERFDETFETLATSADNDALAEAIGTLDDLIVPQVDEPDALFVEHLPMLIDVVARTRGTPAAAIQTPYGNYPGRSGEEIALKVSRLILRLRYADPEQTFRSLVQLYSAATTDTERKIWVDLATEFSANNLDVWKRYGPAIPRFVLGRIGKLSATEIAVARGVVIAMLANVLSGDLRGMTATAETVTIHQATIPASEEVTKFRADAISVLERLLDEAPDDAARRTVLEGLRKGGQHPFNGGSDELAILIHENAARILDIESARAANWGLELRRDTEVNALRCHHGFGVLPPFLAKNELAIAAHEKVKTAIRTLRNAVNQDAEFVLYKTLVGHDSVRPDAWEGRAFDPEGTQSWREAAYPGIVDEITEASVGGWITRVRMFITESRSGSNNLWPLCECFKLLGRAKPQIAVTFLETMDDDLAIVLRFLLLGMDAAGEHDTVRRYIARWEGEGRFLGVISDYLRFQNPFAIDMLKTLVSRAIELVDEVGVLSALSTAVIRHDEAADQRLIDAVFMPAIGFLTDIRKYDWAHFIWGGRKGTLIAALDEAQSQRMLDSFIVVPDLSYEEDRLLALVAIRFPTIVFGFFESRILRDRDESGLRYSAIPHGLHELQSTLAPHPELLIAAARRWHEFEPGLHEFRGGQLFHRVYPELSPEVAARLGELVKRGDRSDIEFVLSTLIPYDGAELVYPLCMDIVDALDEGDVLLATVTRVLGQKGVLTGEFGYVTAEAEQRGRLNTYRDDARAKVQAFVRDLQHRIQQSMAWEQRSAERQVAARKRQWGED